MFDIVLYEPEIPPNTGNAIRLAANTGARLHLVQPMGFTLRDKQLQRAGLDYRALTEVVVHADWLACCDFFSGRRIFAVTTRGTQRYDAPSYRAADVFLFGPETRGLPAEVLAALPPQQLLRLPMRAASRSLNLSNAVAVVIYEAWRQLAFHGAEPTA
jgi:tRNA (cytidine/uridine-2'-O-)-methyltransferase